MTIDAVISALTLDGVRVLEANGDSFFVYDPAGDLPPERRQPFATVVTADSYDSDSDLDRPGVYRLNLGLPKPLYRSLFPEPPADVDHTRLDTVMPHPVYGPQYWICVLSPSAETLAELQPLIDAAYEFVVRKHANHQARQGS
ncbi:hypothetical protein FB561_5608 [Kribbella amoyensis]|uniref:DUF6194 domain-containing protein n=1 Tax=Kribbella amoyensis TaxID=996641 RepID=A0A561BZY0_9ACTN|nr:DUF6194 family protein [Kribbella amoyensis]TWD84421.1 hypothetical protein FB561_5608 [Kribbella amoyensis]